MMITITTIIIIIIKPRSEQQFSLLPLILYQTEIIDDDKKLISAVDLYFIQDDGGRFRVRTAKSTVESNNIREDRSIQHHVMYSLISSVCQLSVFHPSSMSFIFPVYQLKTQKNHTLRKVHWEKAIFVYMHFMPYVKTTQKSLLQNTEKKVDIFYQLQQIILLCFVSSCKEKRVV